MSFHLDEELWFGEGKDTAAEEKAAKSLAATIVRVQGTRPFPEAAQKLMQIVKNADFSVQEVVHTIESDSALAARVLRLVNSAAFALKSRCRTIGAAVTMLGPKRISDIATSAALLAWFEGDVNQELVEHSQSVALLARFIALRVNLPSEELYTVGLLHDFGKLMLLEAGDDAYADLLASTTDLDTIHLRERQLFGYDHAVLAGHIFSIWNLPQPIPKVVAWHHQPARAYANGGDIAKMVAVLRLAERLAHDFKGFHLEDNAAADLPAPWVDTLGKNESVTYLGLGDGAFASLMHVLYRAYVDSKQEKDPEQDVPTDSEAPASGSSKRSSRDPGADAGGHIATIKCGFCGDLTAGEACTRCETPVCSQHAPRGREVCSRCEAEYSKAEVAFDKTLSRWYGVAVAAIALAVVGVGVAATAHEGDAWLSYTALLLIGVGLVGAISVPISIKTRRVGLRERFLRTRAGS